MRVKCSTRLTSGNVSLKAVSPREAADGRNIKALRAGITMGTEERKCVSCRWSVVAEHGKQIWEMGEKEESRPIFSLGD